MSKIVKEFRTASLRNGVIIRSKKNVDNKRNAYATIIELANLGYIVENTEMLNTVNTEELEAILDSARTIVGADRDMEPIYKNFPKEVEETNTLQLLMEQILHYWTNGEYLPNHPKQVRNGLPINEMLTGAKTVQVKYGSDYARSIIGDLTAASVAMSGTQAELLSAALQIDVPSQEKVLRILSNSKNGENIHHFTNAYYRSANDGLNVVERAEMFINAARNPDQLLRWVMVVSASPSKYNDDELNVYDYHDSWKRTVKKMQFEEAYDRAVMNLSDRDAKTVKFKNLPRPVRRMIMERLGEFSKNEKFMDRIFSRRNLWARVFRMIHPYSLSVSGDAARVADIVHGNVKYYTQNSVVETHIRNFEYGSAAAFLKDKNVGDLLNRLTMFARNMNERDFVSLCEMVGEVGAKSTINNLISTINGVYASAFDGKRVVLMGGRRNHIIDTKPLSTERVEMLSEALMAALQVKLAEIPAPLGAVPVRSIEPVSLVRRDLSAADKAIDRGSRFTVSGDVSNVLRLFGHWNNNMGRSGYMDIGAVLLDKDFIRLGVVDWSSWFEARDWAVYSGDKKVFPGESASEYIDVKLDSLPDGTRWVVATIQSWSGFRISDVDLLSGAMFRSDANSGEVFDPRTVVSAFKPVTLSTQSVPFVFDVETREIVWLDGSSGIDRSSVTSRNDYSVDTVVKDFLGRKHFTYGELAELWAKAHGVDTVDEPVQKSVLDSLLKM